MANLERLTHTAGLKDYDDTYSAQFPGADGKIPQIKDAQILRMMKQQTSTDFPPRSQWHHSHTGYATLAMIVEMVSGKPFGEGLHERIFAPLGMKNTLPYERGKNEVPQRAFGYTNRDGRWIEADQSSSRRCWVTAAFIRMLRTWPRGTERYAGTPC